MFDHDEGQREACPVSVEVQVGTQGQDEGDDGHGGTEEGEPPSAQRHGADHQGDQQRDPDIGAVLDGRVGDDLPIRCADRHE